MVEQLTKRLPKSYTKTVLCIIIFLASLAVVSIINAQSASAAAPNATTTLPNNGSPAQPWLVVTRQGTNGMDAPASAAELYVKATAGTNVRFRIDSACDTGWRDQNGSNNETLFRILKSEVRSVISVTNGTDITSDLEAFTKTAPRDNPWLYFRCDSGNMTLNLDLVDSKIRIGVTEYYDVLVQATADANLTAYYVNKFRYVALSSEAVFAYSNVTFNPNGVNEYYTGIAYPDPGQTSGYSWNTKLTFAEPCNASTSGTNRRVWFFDTDHSGSSSSSSPFWQNTTFGRHMSYSITVFNRNTGANEGELLRGTLNGGNNTADFTAQFRTFPNKRYVLEVFNINYVNSLQIALPLGQIQANEVCGNDNPVGFIDSCEINAAGDLVLYGWAYDDNFTSANQPQVSVNVGGNTQTVNSQYNYRSSQINTFLDNRSYPNTGRDNRYGFRITYSGLYKGGNFPISGTVINVGAGSNQAMVVNTSTPITTADGFVDGSSNFPGSVLPQSCLSDPPSPSCSIEINPLEQEVDRNTVITITAIQDTAGDYIVNSVTGTSNPNIGGLSSTGLNDTVGGNRDYTFTVSSATILNYTVSASINTNFGSATCTGPGGVTNPRGSFAFRPYIQTFRGDVTAGYGMVDALGQCSTDANAQIRGFVGSQIGAPSAIVGSGGQLMGHALGAVQGYRSAITEIGANSQPWVRVFANASRVSTDGLANQNYGGQFDTRFCEEDWFKDRPSSYNGSTGTYDLTTFNGTLRYDTASGPVRMTASGQIEDSFKVFVDGDVVIEGASRIEQQQSGWNSDYDIPSVIIVADGNIYIDDSVSVLDATLVSTGTVFTCVNTSGSLPSATNSINDVSPGIYREGGSCNTTPLTLNGAIIADSVRLWRTGGTTTRNNGGLSSGSQSYQEGLTQAETFRLPPELYVVPRFGETPDNQNKFDALLSLPPAF